MKTSKIATINANVKNTQRTINEMKKQKCAHKRLWYCKRANVNENDEKQYGTALLSFRIQIDLSLVLVSSIETRRVYMRNVVITCVSAIQVLKIYRKQANPKTAWWQTKTICCTRWCKKINPHPHNHIHIYRWIRMWVEFQVFWHYLRMFTSFLSFKSEETAYNPLWQFHGMFEEFK